MPPAPLDHGEEVHGRRPGDVRGVVLQKDVEHLCHPGGREGVADTTGERGGGLLGLALASLVATRTGRQRDRCDTQAMKNPPDHRLWTAPIVRHGRTMPELRLGSATHTHLIEHVVQGVYQHAAVLGGLLLHFAPRRESGRTHVLQNLPGWNAERS